MFELWTVLIDLLLCPRGQNSAFALLCIAGAFGVNAKLLCVVSGIFYLVLVMAS